MPTQPRSSNKALLAEYDRIISRMRNAPQLQDEWEIDGKRETMAASLIYITSKLRWQASDVALREFLRQLVETDDFRWMVSRRTRLRLFGRALGSAVYADGETILQRLGCLLPKRERDALIGDSVEAVRLQHSLSVGKPWRKFAVLATIAFWVGVIVKSAVLFAVFSHLPKRSR